MESSGGGGGGGVYTELLLIFFLSGKLSVEESVLWLVQMSLEKAACSFVSSKRLFTLVDLALFQCISSERVLY